MYFSNDDYYACNDYSGSVTTPMQVPNPVNVGFDAISFQAPTSIHTTNYHYVSTDTLYIVKYLEH